MTSVRIGRQTLFKYVLISVMGLIILLTISALIFGQGSDCPLTLKRILNTYVDLFFENIDFIFIQTAIQLVSIWVLGGCIGRLIIDNGKNIYLVGGLSFLILWIILFIGAMITTGVVNSTKYGWQGFTSAISGWLIYGLLPFMLFGMIHGIAMGYILGNEIRNKGKKYRVT
jgi:hypothetical protein